jgi:ribosome-associated protein
MKHTVEKLLKIIAQSIHDKKGFNTIIIDVKGISSMTDYFIIAEGTVDRHVKALAMYIKDCLSEYNSHPLHIEGLQEGDWVVLDYSDFVIHLFIPELREKYALEELWRNGKLVDVPVK